MKPSAILFGLLCAFFCLLQSALLPGQELRVYSEGERPNDVRLGPLKTLNGYFPFDPPKSLETWQSRRTEVRRQILLANGLWPLPEKTDRSAVVHHPIERAEYTVYGVILEVVPEFYASGNLYVPKNSPKDPAGKPRKMPGVLSPHGHWQDGRFFKQGEEAFQQDLKSGAEKYDPSGRFPLQARCATLARLGCVVFHYDMIGYADSVQFPHGPGYRESMNTPKNWGFFSPQAELHLQNMMGLQTLSSLRILDWFETLPEVDPERIGITGASGGGTQSFILSAIDDRICAEFPAVMVSTGMQGGCTCENAPYLRINTGNVEFAGLIAPKPLGMTAADDWTKEMETKGLPELRELFALYGVEGNVALSPHLNFGHNYNFVSRADMYGFMNRHLGLGHRFESLETIEQPFEPLSTEEMTVWTGDHPKPTGEQVGEVFERRLLKEMTAASDKQIAALVPKANDPASFGKFREVIGGAVEVMIGRTLPDSEDVQVLKDRPIEAAYGSCVKTRFINSRFTEEVPALMLVPKNAQADNKNTLLVVFPGGKKDGFEADGTPIASLRKRLEQGNTIVLLDLLGQGELTKDGRPLEQAEIFGYEAGKPPKGRALAYTYGYNHPVFAKRVHDILTVLAGLRKEQGDRITLVGAGGAGHFVAAARAIAGSAVGNCVIDTQGFRFANVEELNDPNMLPGAVKYLDLPGMIALSAPNKTTLLGEGSSAPPLVQAAFAAVGATENLIVSDAALSR